MHVVFRTDASIQIGTGHVMRCLTLADALRQNNVNCTFVCRAHAGHLGELITQRGHAVLMLPQVNAAFATSIETTPAHAVWLGCDWLTDAQQTQEAISQMKADWLVVDHYALDARWEKFIRHQCRKVMVIDDLADRPHDCDLLLDQNLGRSADHYNHLIFQNTPTLIGPLYALLRPEFAQYRASSLLRRNQPKLEHLLITLGGIDKENHTGALLQALMQSRLPDNLRITVVMGRYAPALTDVQALAQEMPCPTTVQVNTQQMAKLMTDSDLIIGAAGGTSWERCCLGVPSIVLVTADNQRTAADALEKMGAIRLVHQCHDVPAIIIDLTLSAANPTQLNQLSEAARHVTDGNGSLRVLHALKDIHA